MKRLRIPLIVLLIHVLVFLARANIPKPEDILGFKVGEDRKLADMHQILDYFQRLDQASGRISVQTVGKTTMGNPFIVAFITSERNHGHLSAYQNYQQLLADPRKITDNQAEEIISRAKAVVMINCSLHASEIGASQMAMDLAYDLAVGNDSLTRKILDEVILVLVPMHNPDGIQMVVDWYNKHIGTDYEGCRMPWLYHKYVGHDNNRDWYMLTQVESRLTIQVHNAWHPHIILDMHQMGQTGPRIFVPPYVDPYEPNVDPILRQEVAMMGTFIASELTAQGKAGVMHSHWFDAWTPARAYHHYHGGIRILTELASAKMATPVDIDFEDLRPSVQKPSVKMPLPWQGGEWCLQDIVDYDHAAAMAVLTNAASLREIWLRNFYRIHRKAVQHHEDPFAFLVPDVQSDYPSAMKMLEVLHLGGVEVHLARSSFEADGYEYPAGTFIVFRSQPYGGYAKALLERQDYPEIREYEGGPLKIPYDVVAHTLPLLMGVDVIQVEAPFEVECVLTENLEKSMGSITGADRAAGFVWDHSTNEDIIALNLLLGKGYRAVWSAESFESNGRQYPSGTMIVINNTGLIEDLQELLQRVCVHFTGLEELPAIRALHLNPARLGLYKSWTASMDEGWTRWVLEQHAFDYESVFDEDIRRGGLEDSYDVIVLSDIREKSIVEGLSAEDVPPEYSGGIGPVGIENIKRFAKSGGTLIYMNSSSDFAIKYLHLAVENDVREMDRRDFFIPGSILKVLNKTDHPIAYGYGRDSSIFFRRSPVFSVHEGEKVVFYPSQSLLSGWVNGEEHLRHRTAVVDVPYEQGRVILIGFPALYRGQAHGTFRYLFNAIYYGASDQGRLVLDKTTGDSLDKPERTGSYD